jgi:hypothetical protein
VKAWTGGFGRLSSVCIKIAGVWKSKELRGAVEGAEDLEQALVLSIQFPKQPAALPTGLPTLRGRWRIFDGNTRWF